LPGVVFTQARDEWHTSAVKMHPASVHYSTSSFPWLLSHFLSLPSPLHPEGATHAAQNKDAASNSLSGRKRNWWC